VSWDLDNSPNVGPETEACMKFDDDVLLRFCVCPEDKSLSMFCDLLGMSEAEARSNIAFFCSDSLFLDSSLYGRPEDNNLFELCVFLGCSGNESKLKVEFFSPINFGSVASLCIL